MKKLGLCVRYDCNNYGSMLQIFATQKMIASMGWEYEHILYNKKTIGFMIKNLTRIFNPYFMRGKLMWLSKAREMRKHPEIMEQNRQRNQLFTDYRKMYIGPYSPVFKGYSALQVGAQRYDAVMVGSDQLWTPAGVRSRFYNLLFVPDRIKKVAFATSFGVNAIPDSQRAITKKYLSRIEHISVREIQGAKIIKELTGRNVVVALDPTLMYTGQEWSAFFPVERRFDQPYIFAYFLGKNPAHREVVQNLAKKTGKMIVTCPHLDEYVESDDYFGDHRCYDVSPVDFLNLIRNADLICTDSFHGSVFSILNHKQFMTFNRFNQAEKQSRNSRIDSLFSLLGLEKRRYSNLNADLGALMEAPIDYATVDENLENLRKQTRAFLKEALEGSVL